MKNMITIWRGKTEYFDEMVDTLKGYGLTVDADKKKYTISVAENEVTRANGLLMELNSELEAGW